MKIQFKRIFMQFKCTRYIALNTICHKNVENCVGRVYSVLVRLSNRLEKKKKNDCYNRRTPSNVHISSTPVRSE